MCDIRDIGGGEDIVAVVGSGYVDGEQPTEYG